LLLYYVFAFKEPCVGGLVGFSGATKYLLTTATEKAQLFMAQPQQQTTP